ncbi:hypothetical protein GO013_08175 [Pseudodesulfovibrio sp. JC047]|uniref:hypothetical protein n=1 Tax=Pseudodesulfovibrio sp. JC047 TaxID=2683199 RepID=UPI0013D66F9C|nr:hypothetical protein [Pseudodesulfovibrio sp. JC047]NDV19393.1 hypothetical protein [Pseudodesulfovibrio sp. JC047]
MNRLIVFWVCLVTGSLLGIQPVFAAGPSVLEEWDWTEGRAVSEENQVKLFAAANPSKEPEYFILENPEDKERVSVEPSTRVLPLWGEEARAQGYTLPLPFGLSLTSLVQRQEPKITDLKFGFGTPSARPGITLDGSEVISATMLARADVWLFPFMNVYGFGGVIAGHADLDINVNGFTLGGVAVDDFQLNIESDYTGYTGGIGVTFAGGYKQYFGSVDMNMARTQLDFLDGEIETYTVTPRVGILVDSEQYGKGNVWAGVMYLNLEERLHGSIETSILPGPGTRSFDYDLIFTTKEAYSVLVGGMWEFSEKTQALVEVSYGGRTSLTGQFMYRF